MLPLPRSEQPRRRLIVPLAGALAASCALAASAPGSADAVALHALSPAGCFSDTGTSVGCTTTDGLRDASSAVVSPDGASVYAAAAGDHAVVRFNRALDGGLTPAGCVSRTGINAGCTTTAGGLLGAIQVAVSPDGASVYAAAVGDSSIVRFNRAPDGALTPAGCISDTSSPAVGCTRTDGLGGASSVAVSRDGASVYVAAFADNAIVRFNRAPDGALTPAGCFSDAGTSVGCTTTPGLDAASSVAVSPDGASVYVAAPEDDAIARFNRAPDGALTPAGCFSDTGTSVGCTTTNGLDSALSVAVSPDSASLYVAAAGDNAVTAFDRASNGALTPAGCFSDTGTTVGCTTTNGLSFANSVAVSMDGASLYVTAANDHAVARFDRAPSGAIAPAGCFSDTGTAAGCVSTDGLGGARSVAVSPDNASVYAAGTDDSALVRFKREVPPRCAAVASNGGPGAVQTVPLDCFDPNGDPLEITIASPPRNGTLGTVNQVSDTVTYTPDAGFAGADTFEFGAVADGKPSGPASATVFVQPAQGPSGPPGAQGPPGPAGAQGEPAVRLLGLLALRTTKSRTGRRLKIPFVATGPGTSKIEIREGKRVRVRIVSNLTRAGRFTVKWSGRPGLTPDAQKRSRARLAPGKYTVVLEVTDADGQRSTDSARLRITR